MNSSTLWEVHLIPFHWLKSSRTSGPVWSDVCLSTTDIVCSHRWVDCSWITICTINHTKVISADSEAYKKQSVFRMCVKKKSYYFPGSIMKRFLRNCLEALWLLYLFQSNTHLLFLVIPLWHQKRTHFTAKYHVDPHFVTLYAHYHQHSVIQKICIINLNFTEWFSCRFPWTLSTLCLFNGERVI